MTFPALPAPAPTDPPNVPSDLGNVATAAVNQAAAQYAGYTTTNSPSASSIEARTTAIDGPGGTVAAVETSSAALTANVYTWTGSATSNIATQAARTAAFTARQDGHDTLIATLNGQLATYEPQITSLINTRPAGLLFTSAHQYNTPVSDSGSIFVTSYNFVPRSGSIYYRMSFTGAFNFTGAAAAQSLDLTWVAAAGSNPQASGSLAGHTGYVGTPNAYLPIACYGVVPLTGSGSPWTLSLVAAIGGPGQGHSGLVVGYCGLTIEDLGSHF